VSDDLHSANSDDDDHNDNDHDDDNDDNDDKDDDDGKVASTSSTRRAGTRESLSRHRHRDRVFVFANGVDASAHDSVFFALPHVRDSQRLVRFALCQRQVFELQACREAACSWLLDENVVRDGTLYVATAVDPLFLLVPRLVAVRQAGVFVEASVVFESADTPAYRYLSEQFVAPTAWHSICDVKLAGPVLAVRLSDEKLAAWLDAKVIAIADALKADASLARFAPTRDAKAVATTFKATSTDAATSAATAVDFVRNAVAYVSEYLTTAQADALAERFGVRVVAADMNPLSLAKRMAMAPGKAVDDILAHVRKENEKKQKEAAAAAKKQLTFGQKQLAKVDKRGMKPMTSFFSVTKKAKIDE
jgi:ribonuclease H2 subunit B